MYRGEIEAWQRLNSKSQSVALGVEESAEHERLKQIAYWVFDDDYPG